ncbi:hypothetical protein TrLO_g10378 [Triparma laevis f. longispina]|uniref:Kinesin light chain n=1 Tax=Triparma laevis f. longispina TaxID=1714387 RepID=A0A9W6ZLF3_9STRA|nr:hypothetical protein TrLO_g10378 [Triparma laevis f. longispina]
MKSGQSLSEPAALEEEDDEYTCIICLANVVNAKLRPCGHSATKKIAGFDVGKWQSSIGEHGLWPTSLKNLSELASGESFNEYFQKQFNGNEEAYLRWKEVFDVLEIGNARDIGPDLPLEKKSDPRKLEILDACLALGRACYNLKKNGEYEEAKEVLERCLAGRTTVLGENHKKTLDTLNNLGVVYRALGNYEKTLECYERALEGREKTFGNNYAMTLGTVMSTVTVNTFIQSYGKAEPLFQRALEGYEAQLGKDNKKTKDCANNFKLCWERSGNSERLAALISSYPGLD